MGAIVRLLTLEALSDALGASTARLIFNLSRGIDDEPVKSTVGALTKTITSYKSFPRVIDLIGLDKWIMLLANDLVSRVDLDLKRNHRFPKTCTVHFHCADQGKKCHCFLQTTCVCR